MKHWSAEEKVETKGIWKHGEVLGGLNERRDGRACVKMER
jgi:hypothetical protein